MCLSPCPYARTHPRTHTRMHARTHAHMFYAARRLRTWRASFSSRPSVFPAALRSHLILLWFIFVYLSMCLFYIISFIQSLRLACRLTKPSKQAASERADLMFHVILSCRALPCPFLPPSDLHVRAVLSFQQPTFQQITTHQ